MKTAPHVMLLHVLIAMSILQSEFNTRDKMIPLSGDILGKIFQYIRFTPEHPILPEGRSLAVYAPYWTFSSDSNLSLLPSYIYCLEIKDDIYISDKSPLNICVRYLVVSIHTLLISKMFNCKTILLKKSLDTNTSISDLDILSQVTSEIKLQTRMYGSNHLKNILQVKCSGVIYILTAAEGFFMLPGNNTSCVHIYPRKVGKPFEVYYDMTLITDDILKILSDIVGLDIDISSKQLGTYYCLIISGLRIQPYTVPTKYIIATPIPLSVTVDEVTLKSPKGIFTRAPNIALTSYAHGSYAATHIHLSTVYKCTFTAPNVQVIILHDRHVIYLIADLFFDKYPSLETVLVTKTTTDSIQCNLDRFSKVISCGKYYQYHRAYLDQN